MPSRLRYSPWRPPVPLLTFAAVLSLVTSCRDAPDRLRLTEAGAVTLPDSLQVTGVDGDERGRTLLWTREGNLLLYDGDRPIHLRPDSLRYAAGAALLGDTTHGIEVVDGLRGTLMRFDARGRQINERPVDALRGAALAVRARDGWFAIARDSGARVSLRYLPHNSGVGRTLKSLDGRSSQAVRLSPLDTRLLVTSVEAPHASLLVDPETGAVEQFLVPAGVAALADSAAHWWSMPVVAVSPGYLQVLADLTSDRRLFVLYDAQGRVVRTTELNAPIAIVGGRRNGRHLLGMRRTGRPEVVDYAWEWAYTNEEEVQ